MKIWILMPDTVQLVQEGVWNPRPGDIVVAAREGETVADCAQRVCDEYQDVYSFNAVPE